MEQQEKPVFKLSVKALVEFCCRQGDLISGFQPTSSAQEGIHFHKVLQDQRPESYEPEVSVRIRIVRPTLEFVLRGRIDGVFPDPVQPIIEEIKTNAVTPDALLDSTRLLHMAQAKIYAYIYLTDHDLSSCQIQMTYFHVLTEHETNELSDHTLEELSEFYEQCVEPYLQWLERYVEYKQQRDTSIKALNFPHSEYRPGQREFAVAIYRTIAQQKGLLAEAPTGIGKTISALFPAVKAIGEGLHDNIVFLTAKTLGRTVAEQAMAEMESQGMQLKSITITAKDKICFCKNGTIPRNDEELCPYTVGFYDRLRDAMTELFAEHSFSRSTIERLAEKHQLCPFEFTLELALWADVIIADYNYLFHPTVALRRFKDQKRKKFSLLIDEAHNLIDRARDMFSVELSKNVVLALKRQIKDDLPTVASALNGINKMFLELKKTCLAGDFGKPNDSDGAFVSLELAPLDLPLRLFCSELEQLAKEGFTQMPDPDTRQMLLEFYFEVLLFLKISELFDENFRTLIADVEQSSMKVSLYCMDPARMLQEVYNLCKGTVFFSATLKPFDFYARSIGAEETAHALELVSPFPPENSGIFVASYIQTNYRQRSQYYETIADLLISVVEEKVGNYLVSFPSYQFLDTVREIVEKKEPGLKTIVQQAGMDEESRLEFLQNFTEASQTESLLGFTIMGGLFGEGIDLPGDRLIGMVVVGVGLPQICVERDLIRDHFNQDQKPGFDYAYQFPGMNRVLQSAGRVIRGPKDKGIVVLVDDRFFQMRYRRLFPKHWHYYQVRSNGELQQHVSAFWKGHQVEEEED